MSGKGLLVFSFTVRRLTFLHHFYRLVLTSLLPLGALLTALCAFLEFLPKMLDRQIILLFESGEIKTPEGQQWGYLMVFGATGLRITSFVISNYTE
jgi:hypothetical protein